MGNLQAQQFGRQENDGRYTWICQNFIFQASNSLATLQIACFWENIALQVQQSATITSLIAFRIYKSKVA